MTDIDTKVHFTKKKPGGFEGENLYVRPNSLTRQLIQKLFLTLLLRFFPKKFLSYKNKIKFKMDRGGYLLRLYLTCTYLRFRHPLYFKLPSTQLLSLIHISEPTRRTPISYAVFCLKKNSFVGVKKLNPEDEELQKTFRTLYAYDIKHYD